MGNRRVRVIWSDLNGLAHGRYVPEGRLGLHGHHAVTTLCMGLDSEILPIEGYSADVGYPDLSTVPLVETRRPGWEPDTDVVVADLEYHHEPLALCPRGALKRAVQAWRSLGFEPHLGFEMEFYVLQPDPEAPGGWGPLDNPAHRVYGVGRGADPTGLLLELYDMAEHLGLSLEGMMSEFCPGQLELNMRYGPALDAADRAFVCKEMTYEVAARRGYKVTYLGLPVVGFTGSGLHVNFSLSPVDGGLNSFDDPSAPDGISSLARQCIAGLMEHHEAATALMAPLINSYRRLRPGMIAGYWANWGLDNRISTYRVPHQRGAATRIENRLPCASASPYLAAAATLNAALLGVVDGLDCGEPQVGDADSAPNTDRHTPHTLAEALEALEANTVLTEAMGPDLVRAYLALRRHELARFEATGEEWSDDELSRFEQQEYLRLF
jgi:glutamine synthetase